MGDTIGSMVGNLLGGVEKGASGLLQGVESGIGGMFGKGAFPATDLTSMSPVAAAPALSTAGGALPSLSSAVPSTLASAPMSAASMTGGIGDLGSFGATAAPSSFHINADLPASVTSAMSATSPAAAASGGGGLLGGNIGKYALPAGLLAMSLSQAGKEPPALKSLEALAKQQSNLAGGLSPAAVAEMTTGNLPAGAQASIDQNLASAQASIRSRYADMGLSGSTMESQDLSAAKDRAMAMQWQMAQELATQGLTLAEGASGQASNLYQAILNSQVSQDNALGQALAGFAGALVT